MGVGHWGGIPEGMGWGSRHMVGFQTGVGFQSCGGIPDRDSGVPDRDSGVLDRWWYTRCR